ncbi:MAG: 50S ribosomal protein L17 [Bacilli bacterium]|jgi:large subunit ribosomal protein L17|nr:50S ribosomal protein L17 [Bacilli bacterium]MDD3388960.1 50S ribosomal protein L17 [Bacilli bacterium]MDD4344399.1 50S ribosomal protein L17 [Bacilli bacterium]MDD4520697.1 50S ribosomal protein L17 [Bacilli bacterium]MDY0399328.1 50S ribosomal protein L17 [Bacilli bacterium]
MGTIGRKNVHGKGGVRFKAGYTVSKDKSMIRNVVSELIVHGRVQVGEKVAHQVSRQADRLVTLAKAGDLHSRRLAAAIVREGIKNADGVTALDVLFNEIGPRYKDRNGGYTRVLKLVARRGDNAPMALLEFVK